MLFVSFVVLWKNSWNYFWNDLQTALTCTLSSGLTGQKIEGRRRNAKYTRGKRINNWHLCLQSASFCLLQFSWAASTPFYPSSIYPSADEVSQFCLVHAKPEKELESVAAHGKNLWQKFHEDLNVNMFLISNIWHCSEYLWCMHKRENSDKILEN